VKNLWNQFLVFSRAKQIGVVVAVLHAVIIFSLMFSHIFSKAFTKHPKQIAVRTTLIPQKQLVSSTPTVSTPKKEIPVVSRQEKKKVPIKNQAKEKVTEKSVDTSLFQHISKQLDAITSSAPPSPSKTALLIPSLVDIKSDTSSSTLSPIYSGVVATILQQNLELPEIGDVIARIEIDSQGNVTFCEIIDEKSRKNSEFLKKRLQELSFPCFNEFGLTENQIDFTVTFRNVERR